MRFSDIREHMPVYGSCGQRVGTVDRVQGECLRLTRDPGEGDDGHLVPLDWVDEVADHVRLSRPCEEVLRRWQPAAAAGW
jgi:hypothetical protein